MLIVEIKNGETIDRALRLYKRKHQQVKLMKELRTRKQFVKPSVKRRHEKLHAIYLEKKRIETV